MHINQPHLSLVMSLTCHLHMINKHSSNEYKHQLITTYPIYQPVMQLLHIGVITAGTIGPHLHHAVDPKILEGDRQLNGWHQAQTGRKGQAMSQVVLVGYVIVGGRLYKGWWLVGGISWFALQWFIAICNGAV